MLDIGLVFFADLVDDTSWNEFMPTGVDKATFKKFSKYYDKDIFVAASRRIRYIAKTADELEPTERVKKIASLFATFKNPDKETVLTPWRVVNMHMSDTIGGYDFFDESHNNMIEEPRFVNQTHVTSKVFTKDAKILEINSKTGLYPLYVTYSLYREAIKNLGDISFDKKLEYWDNTIKNQVFVICKTPMAKLITKRTLLGYRNGKTNMHSFDDLVMQLKDKQAQFIQKVLKPSFWNLGGNGQMKFNAIVGNPPYQIMDGGNGSSSIPVYNLFVTSAIKIKPQFTSMIMPSRWFSGGKGLDDFRAFMLNDKHIRVMHDYMDASRCFTNASIEGGVCYFLYDNNNEGKCKYYLHQANDETTYTERYLKQNDKVDIVIRDNLQQSILDKVMNKTSKFLNTIVYPRNPFGIVNFDVINKSDYSILGRFDNKREVRYLSDINCVKKNKELISKYKVFVSKADGAAGQIGNPIPAKILGDPEFGDVNQVCTETFLAMGPFKNESEAKNLEKYLMTKFARFMVGIRKNKNMTQDTYSFVPLLDFTKNYSDDELYSLLIWIVKKSNTSRRMITKK